MRKILFWIFLVLLLIVIAAGGYLVPKLGPIASAYAAKALCSCTFISDRDAQQIFEEELDSNAFLNYSIDKSGKSATADVIGLFERKAIYREGLGCTLVLGSTEEEVRQTADLSALIQATDQSARPWPTGDSMGPVTIPPEIDAEGLNSAINWAFEEPDPKKIKRTRAVVVLHKGRLIAEQYAPGFDANTPQLGWSMAKSITHALMGIIVRQGKLDIHAPAPVDAWQGGDDPRAKITTDQLIRMSSGLKFEETYALLTDVAFMLFREKNAGEFAANMPLEGDPDSRWNYASGTSNILHHILKKQIGGTQMDYLNFPRKELFDRIGMQSAILETDAAGYYVGSSFDYATPRDWARFGLLYAQDGVWEGERILPEGWAAYAAAPTPKAPNGIYGAHWWTNGGGLWPELPKDLYRASGYEGQSVTIVPSYDLVVVRLGQTGVREHWDYVTFMKKILEAVPVKSEVLQP